MSYEEEYNLSSLMIAQRVQLYVNPKTNITTLTTANLNKGNAQPPKSLPGSGNSQLATMRGLNINASHPRRRINHGMQRFYTHAAPDITMSFVVSGDDELLSFLEARVKRINGSLPIYDWWVRATSNDGTNVDRGFSGQLESINFEKPLESQDDPYDITCDIIVQQQTLT